MFKFANNDSKFATKIANPLANLNCSKLSIIYYKVVKSEQKRARSPTSPRFYGVHKNALSRKDLYDNTTIKKLIKTADNYSFHIAKKSTGLFPFPADLRYCLKGCMFILLFCGCIPFPIDCTINRERDMIGRRFETCFYGNMQKSSR